MKKDIIIDFESLSTDPHAVLLSMGIVVIDINAIDPLDYQKSFDNIIKQGAHWKFKVSNQQRSYRRVISTDTVEWWSTQTDSASMILMPHASDVDLIELPTLINAYLKEHGYTSGKCYTRGMIDGIWLQSLCSTLKQDVNIEWWDYRDVRTFIDCMSGSENGYLPKEYKFNPVGLIKHNALHDCALDAIQMYKSVLLSDNFDDDMPF